VAWVSALERDRATLAAVGELTGIDAVVRRRGRPSGGGGDGAAQWIDARPDDVTQAVAVGKAAAKLGWSPEAMLGRCRRSRACEGPTAGPTGARERPDRLTRTPARRRGKTWSFRL
jgi:hypothetical protein